MRGREFVEAEAFWQHREPAFEYGFGADLFFSAFDSRQSFFENFADADSRDRLFSELSRRETAFAAAGSVLQANVKVPRPELFSGTVPAPASFFFVAVKFFDCRNFDWWRTIVFQIIRRSSLIKLCAV